MTPAQLHQLADVIEKLAPLIKAQAAGGLGVLPPWAQSLLTALAAIAPQILAVLEALLNPPTPAPTPTPANPPAA